jgi:hypothetical protein
MSHMGNWSPDKRRRAAATLGWEARCRTVDNLLAAGVEAIVDCRQCGHVGPLDLVALSVARRGHVDVCWGPLRLRCSACSLTIAGVEIRWDDKRTGLSPPPMWKLIEMQEVAGRPVDLAQVEAFADRFEKAGMKLVAAMLRSMAAELNERRIEADGLGHGVRG